MKRLLLVFLASFLLAFTLWYFTGTPDSQKKMSYGPRKEASVSTDRVTGAAARRSSTTRSSAESEEPEVHISGSTQSLWEAFRTRAGFSSRTAQDAPEASQPITQADMGSTQNRQASASTQKQDRLPPSIAGRVLDDAGQPVTGMELSAQAVRLFQAPEGSAVNGIVVRTSSHDAGAYQFEELPEGEYRIRTTETASYLPSEIVVRTGVQSADLVVSGESTLTIQGSVKDTQGKPLERVQVVSTQPQSPEASTGKDGSYQLQLLVKRSDRNYVLKFRLAGYREETRQLNESQIKRRDTVRVDAQLSPVKAVATVGGKVTNREGAPLARELVQLLGKARYQTMTDPGGEFVMAHVEADQSYRLSVPAHSPYKPYTQQVQVGPDGLYQNIVVELGLPETASISGRMMDAAGNPLPRFSLLLRSSNPAAREPLQVTSDDMGRYWVDDVPLGSLIFTTRSSPWFNVIGINLSAEGAENVDLILDWAPFEVYGQVLDLAGKAVPDSKVVLNWSYQYSGIRSLSQRETSTDANGVFRFTQIGPGAHSIRVSAPGFRETRLEQTVGANTGGVTVQLEGNSQTAHN